MSLVGSLEDLGLGDILQIVSLSRKSGLLLLRSEEGEGRIVFCDGLVRAAFVKGEAEDLKSLLVTGGFLDPAEYERAAETAAAHGDPVADLVAKLPQFSKERLDSLRREHVERSVYRMFAWKSGEFSFEIRDEIDSRDRELLLRMGINSQYLTMEATRLGDEKGRAGGDDDIQFGTIDDAVAREPMGSTGSEAVAPAPTDALALAVAQRVDAVEAEDDEVESVEIELLEPDGVEAGPEAGDEAVALVHPEEPAASVEAAAPAAEAARPVAAARPTGPTALVLIDPDLAALEWQKSVLGPICRRIHIFQRAENGITRIRQYLRRGEEPCVLVSRDVPGDPSYGIADPLALIRRLRAHAPRMPIFLVHAGSEAAPPEDVGAANGSFRRPANHLLANRRAWSKVEGDGAALREAMLNAAAAVGACEPQRPRGRPAAAGAAQSIKATDLQRLKSMSDRLRDPSVRGEVLSLILEFASECFERVAIFMVRDDEAVGMAQAGLARAGGPTDEAFRNISIPVRRPSWLRNALERREGVAAPPGDPGDRELAELLGSAVAPQAYVAPIESNQQVVALVYADNLPQGAPIGETTALEIVLHEAGLALERALLERALARAAEPGRA